MPRIISLCSICTAPFALGDQMVVPHRGKYRAAEYDGRNSGYHPRCWRTMMSLPAATDEPKLLAVKPDFSIKNRQITRLVKGKIPAHWN